MIGGSDYSYPSSTISTYKVVYYTLLGGCEKACSMLHVTLYTGRCIQLPSIALWDKFLLVIGLLDMPYCVRFCYQSPLP